MSTAAQPRHSDPIPAGDYLPAADITLFRESSLNPRRTYDKKKLAELQLSMAKSGQLTPVTARVVDKKGVLTYELASGHRRLRAAQALGLTTIKAIVRRMDDAEFIEVLNVDNLQREDVHPLEEAEGYKNWLTVDGMNVEGIMAKTGKSESYVYDRLKLLALTKPAQKLFLEHRFTAGHAILLARLSPADQKRCLDLGEDRWDSQEGGMWQRHHGHDPVGVEETLELNDDESGEQRKPVSVRELQTWIDDHCRFEKPDAATPHLFARTAENLAAVAAMPKPKLVEITRSYVLKDDVKDPNRKVLTERSWCRADGQPEADEHDDKPTKTCDYSVMGLVVAGEGRGESFLVCINKKKCTVHYGAEIKERNKRERSKKSPGIDLDKEPGINKRAAAADARAAAKAATLVAEQDAWYAAAEKGRGAVLAAVVVAIKKVPTGGETDVAKYVLDMIQEGIWGIGNKVKAAAKLLPRGRGGDAFLRHLVFADVHDRITDTRSILEWQESIDEAGLRVNAKKFVEPFYVAPKVEKPEKKEDPKKPAKAKKKKAKGK